MPIYMVYIILKSFKKGLIKSGIHLRPRTLTAVFSVLQLRNVAFLYFRVQKPCPLGQG